MRKRKKEKKKKVSALSIARLLSCMQVLNVSNKPPIRFSRAARGPPPPKVSTITDMLRRIVPRCRSSCHHILPAYAQINKIYSCMHNCAGETRVRSYVHMQVHILINKICKSSQTPTPFFLIKPHARKPLDYLFIMI